MKDNEKLIKLVHEQELQIATLLHEVSFYREKCVAFGLQKFEAEVESQWTKKEVARLGGVVMDLESKLNAWRVSANHDLDKPNQRHDDVAGHPLAGYSAQQAERDDDLDDYDGPDDVDVERMQSTADHDPEAMPNPVAQEAAQYQADH